MLSLDCFIPLLILAAGFFFSLCTYKLDDKKHAENMLINTLRDGGLLNWCHRLGTSNSPNRGDQNVQKSFSTRSWCDFALISDHGYFTTSLRRFPGWHRLLPAAPRLDMGHQ